MSSIIGLPLQTHYDTHIDNPRHPPGRDASAGWQDKVSQRDALAAIAGFDNPLKMTSVGIRNLLDDFQVNIGGGMLSLINQLGDSLAKAASKYPSSVVAARFLRPLSEYGTSLSQRERILFPA